MKLNLALFKAEDMIKKADIKTAVSPTKTDLKASKSKDSEKASKNMDTEKPKKEKAKTK